MSTSAAWNCTWTLDIPVEWRIWVDTASYRDKIEKALGATHYVKNNKLYRR